MTNLKDVIHMYLGVMTNKGKLIGVEGDCTITFSMPLGGRKVWGVSEIKPILRPLSVDSLTDEEVNEVWGRMGLSAAWRIKDRLRLLSSFFSNEPGAGDESLTLSEANTILTYLRSISVDCDNLIESNQAIEKV